MSPKKNELDAWLENNSDFVPINEDELIEDSSLHQKKNKKNNGIPELDLHGLTSSKAIFKTAEFIQNQPQSTKKVRVIHGKGHHSGKGGAVLQKEIREWLKRKRQEKKLVEDFQYEKPQNGGTGATLVWILH